MTSIIKQYTNEVYRQLGYHASWPPDKLYGLGQVGYTNAKVFYPLSDLQKLDIVVDKTDDKTKGDIAYHSSGSISFNIDTGLTAPTSLSANPASVGLKVSFNREGALLLHAKATRHISVKDKLTLGRQLLQLVKADVWEKNWVVISDIILCDSLTVLIGNSRTSEMVLSSQVQLPAGQFNLAEASLALSVVSEKNMAFKVVAKQKATPMFRLMGLKSGFRKKKQIAYKDIQLFDTKSERFVELDWEMIE